MTVNSQQELTSGFSAHFVDAATGTNTADDEHNDEDHNSRYCRSDSDGFIIIAEEQIVEKQHILLIQINLNRDLILICK